MSTRTIVTSQPDVACDVCERRLLRGEQSEVFLAAGRPRTVCELCAPRATHEGWLRESDERSVSQPPLRTRRGRNLFGRLLQTSRLEDAAPEPAVSDAPYAGEERYDFLGGEGGAAASAGQAPLAVGAHAVVEGEELGQSPADALLLRAIDAFNQGEGPRRVASLARSLGKPSVNVREDEDLGGVVTIVVAWELCWYRYRVDVDEQNPGVSVTEQGNELEELARADLLANAAADELGALSLMDAHA